jgi:hypothetical protein
MTYRMIILYKNIKTKFDHKTPKGQFNCDDLLTKRCSATFLF